MKWILLCDARPRLGIVIVYLAVAGCALLSPPKIAIEKAVLNQLPPDVPHRDSDGKVVLVLQPDTTPPYDTLQMAYRMQPEEVAYFSQREWAATPSRMLHPLLVKTLETTRAFREVLVPPYTGRYDYALRTEILDLVQDFGSSPSATLVLSVRFELTDYGTNQVIATKGISLREPMPERNSRAGVLAANAATAKALQQVAAFVLEETD